MNMRQKLRCILTIMGIITVCTACIVQKDPVDNSDDWKIRYYEGME